MALIAAGIEPGDRVGLVSENRIEWRVADLGILAAGAVTVSPHATLAPRQILFELADSGVRWLFVSGSAMVSVAEVARQVPALRGIVAFDQARGASSWDGFLAGGATVSSSEQKHFDTLQRHRTSDDLCCILYTSGTTGTPKGVMLTHGNILFNCEAILRSQPRQIEGLVLSWLPLSHIFGRTVDHYLHLASGATVALADSAETVIGHCLELRPHYLASVPRFYEKVLAATRPGPSPSSPGLRAAFGGCIRWLTCGGAPLATDVQAAYEEADLPMFPGYGLTETSPVISFNGPGHNKAGTVGPPLPGVEVQIAPDGEILTRGPHVMKGYWKQPAATHEALSDGWFHTGDLGSLDADGYLSITGRKKEIIVLSNGKKVVPSAIEGLLTADHLIDQAAVGGDGRPFLSAVIVTCWVEVRRLLSAHYAQLSNMSNAELACRAEVRELLAERISSRLAEVAPWEHVRRFVIATEPFTVESGELTVSLKLRRQAVLDRYAEQLAAVTA
jgi:long-chain acyl-CoA synthetase